MNNSELISNEIYKEIFDSYIEEQAEELNTVDMDELDSVYVPLFEFYRSSSPEDQNNIINYLKEIVADTTSIILGGIDGTERLGELSGDFELQYNGDVVNGNLQENFLLNFQNEDGINDEIPNNDATKDMFD